MYCLETRLLNQAVKSNEKLFPVDFIFKLTEENRIVQDPAPKKIQFLSKTYESFYQ